MSSTVYSYRFKTGAMLLTTAVLLITAVLILSRDAGASSHREAPLISQDPFADNTDTYVFVSPNDPERLVLLASWIPFEGAEGGPNYFEWGRDVLYDIHVDNDGDAIADFTYTLSSEVEISNPGTFLYNTGPIDSPADPDWNRRQRYTVVETTAIGETTLVDNELAAPANVGRKSTPDYEGIEQQAVYTFNDGSGDIHVFAGQTDDPFFVDLQVFDLLTLREHPSPIGYTYGGYNQPVDSVSGYNVHTLAIELPISRLVDGDPVLGVWATARRSSMQVLNGIAGVLNGDGLVQTSGDPVQVSRLGMPLVNEAVLPYALKDAFNSLSPDLDLAIYTDPTFGPILQKSVEDPEVGNLLCALYGVQLPGDSDGDCATEFTVGSPRSGRGDIFDIFLTGMVLADEFTIRTANGKVALPAGFNINQPANVVPADMIRINTTISGDLCKPKPSRLGVLGGDACGFPNGRRLIDDVTDIAIFAVMGATYEALDGRDSNFEYECPFPDDCDEIDGVNRNDLPFRDSFPYVAYAQAGDIHYHQNVARNFRICPRCTNRPY